MSTSAASPAPELSIIIVTYNPGEIVVGCLTSVFAACAGLAAEIIVVDNCSQDGTLERIQQAFPAARFIANPDNLGFAAANNVGLKAATGKYLLLLNPDVVVEPDAFRQMIDYLAASPGVGIVGPRTFTGQGQIAESANGAYTPLGILWQFWGLKHLFPLNRVRQQAALATAPLPVAWVQGSCLMFRREVYEAIGGLEAGFFMFCEEPDFCDRAARAGWQTAYLPQARVTHYESTTVSRYPLVKMRHYHLSPLYYFRKRRRFAAVRILKAGFIAELGMKYLVRRVQAAVRRSISSRAKVEAYPMVIREIWRY
jgi:GT2 family glycosyltransferase